MNIIPRQLIAQGVRYFSENDEAAFFEWLDKIPAVEKFEGRGNVLYINIDPDAVDEDCLREFLALFHRYGVDLRQLSAFDRPEFSEWFKNERAFWFDRVFRPAT